MTAGVRVPPISNLGLRGFLSGKDLVRDFKSWGGTIVRGGMEKINDKSVEVSTPVDPTSETRGARSVELIWPKLKDFDLLDWATQQSISELQA